MNGFQSGESGYWRNKQERETHEEQEMVGAFTGVLSTQGPHKTLTLEKGRDPGEEAGQGHGHGPNNGEVFHSIWTTKA